MLSIVASGENTKEIIIEAKPKIIMIPKSGEASRFESKNVNDNVLK